MVGLIRHIDGPDNETGTMEEDPYMHVISRKEWGAHPPTKEIPTLLNLLGNVRFTHTQTERCATHNECKKVLKKLQFYQMDTLGFPDITYK